MSEARRGVTLVSVLLACMAGCGAVATAQSPLSTTMVQDTVYNASGAPASGTVLVSWAAFTTASGASIPAGSTSATIGAGGVLSIPLAPDAGATPLGSYYTATFHLSDGTTSRQYWVVPVTVPGGGPAKLAAIQNQVLPTSMAMQTVSKAYVDHAIAAAVTGAPADTSSLYVLKAGDTLTGPLVLPADPVSANQAADKNYVDENVAAIAGSAISSGTINAARLPVFGPSGSAHAQGVVPDPGTTAGSARYLREDGTWNTPATPGPSGGTLAVQNANAAAITGGTIDGTAIGNTTPSSGSFTTLNTKTGTFGSGGNGFTYPVSIVAGSGGGGIVWTSGSNQWDTFIGGNGDFYFFDGSSDVLDISPTSGVLNGNTLCTSAGGMGCPGILYGTTGNIGGSALAAGTCASGTVTVMGALVGSVVTHPNATDGSLDSPLEVVSAAVASANTVTVQRCATAATTPVARSYNVRVIQ